MPIHEFVCPDGHVTEKVFLTFGEAEDVNEIICKEEVPTDQIFHVHCNKTAVRKEFSMPFPGHFYQGKYGGFHKPSPTKRYSTKLASSEGNQNSEG